MTCPLCENCKWFKRPNTCDAPKNRLAIRRPDLVTRSGDVGYSYGYRWLTCNWQRSFGWYAFLWRACGTRGRWFEPKGAR